MMMKQTAQKMYWLSESSVETFLACQHWMIANRRTAMFKPASVPRKITLLSEPHW